MRQYEYKLHFLQLKYGKSKEDQLLEALNRFGSEGWRLNRMYSEVSIRSLMSWRGGFNLILERTSDSPDE